jgi:gamma-glutamyltranspeptidase
MAAEVSAAGVDGPSAALLETFGTRTIVEVLAPAVEYAEQGFPMYEYMHRILSIRETRTQFALYPPGGEAVFYPDGRAPRVGERFRQPALAGTLKNLVAAGAQSTATGSRASARCVSAFIAAMSRPRSAHARKSGAACYVPLISRAIARNSSRRSQ